ncbi:MAG: DUF2270 domain-containing protein [Pirellulales bacterium]|nr:DUF2270 domain-containing protein [Pirellulales bacterium]
MTVWRQRLDVTGNWAILLVVALITFTLGSPDVPHFTLLLGLALIGISALIEGRRYRHLHHSGWRLYLMEQGYFARMVCPLSESRVANWQKALANDLQRPRLLISWFTGTRVRLRRNYLMIVYFVAAAWITKLFIHPGRPSSVQEFVDRFAIGDIIPPWLVILCGFVFVGGMTGLAISCPASEKIEKWHGAFERGMHAFDGPAREGESSQNGGSPTGDH